MGGYSQEMDELEYEVLTPETMLSVKDSFLGFPVDKVSHDFFQGELRSTTIFFNVQYAKPYEVSAAFTEKYFCMLDEMNSTDYMVCYRLEEDNLAIFSLNLNFTLEVTFSSVDAKKYHKTKPLLDEE